MGALWWLISGEYSPGKVTAMTTSTTNYPTIQPTDCPAWCQDHGQPHQVTETNPIPGSAYAVMHRADIEDWNVVTLAYLDEQGRQLEAAEPEVSALFDWVSDPVDIRETARGLLRVADAIEHARAH